MKKQAKDSLAPDTAPRAERTPAWVWAIIVTLACIEPVSHLWIQYFPPKGSVPTGLSIPDTAIFVHSMNMFETGFYSPYATCKSAFGPCYIGYYAAPFYWPYGAAGVVGRWLGAGPFVWLGIVNGLGGFLYLFAAYRFFREAAPPHSNRAFLLFSLGGGLGGILFVLTGMLGLHDAPGFEAYFRRFALYDLIEGPVLSPALHMPRLYYTIPLALCYGALTAFIKALRIHCPRHYGFSAFLLFAGTFLNPRFGPVAWLIGVAYVMHREGRPVRRRFLHAVLWASPVIVGGTLAYALLRSSPAFVVNCLHVVRQNMWLTPFLSASFFSLFVVTAVIRRSLPRLPQCSRLIACSAIGYLAVFSVLFLVYQVFYGNILVARDGAVAAAVSDYALIGALLGAAYARFPVFLCVNRHPQPNRHPERSTHTEHSSHPERSEGSLLHQDHESGEILRSAQNDREAAAGDSHLDSRGLSADANAREPLGSYAWVVIWLLGALAVSVSAFGQGWFLQFTPQRLMIFLGPPIAILSAVGLERWRPERPRLSRIVSSLIVGSGAISILVAALCFQGPLCFAGARTLFSDVRCQVMMEADGRLLSQLPPGTVLTTKWFSDIISLRPGARVLTGMGALDLSDQPWEKLSSDIARFFSPDSSNAFRRSFVDEWRVDYIYCPASQPVDSGRLAQIPWLQVQASDGAAVLFRVAPEEAAARIPVTPRE